MNFKYLTILSLFTAGINICSAQVSFKDYFNETQIEIGYGNGVFGGGVSFVDFNNDGFDDLTFTSQAQENLVFLLSNGTDLQAVNLSIELICESKQVLWADYDNDGDQDLFVMCLQETVRLFEQVGPLIFEERIDEFKMPIVGFNGYAFTLLDLNRNGFLDLVTTSYNNKGTFLFLNNTNGGFEIKGGTGLEVVRKATLQVINLDYNNDGLEDIYLANDRSSGNNLLLNNGDSTFTDISNESNTGIAMDGMGLLTLNTDDNYFPDFYISNSEAGNVLFQNQNGTESNNIASDAGLLFGGSAWGIAMADFNLDQYNDVYVSGSNVGSDVISSELYLRKSRSSFEPAQVAGMMADTVNSFGNATGDYNNDGKPDIAVNNSSPFNHQLWQNTTDTPNKYIKVNLNGVLSNKDGIGARIAYCLNGERKLLWKHSAYSYLSQSTNTQIIGIGEHTKIDSLFIQWPSNIVDKYYDLAGNSTYELSEGETNTKQDLVFSRSVETLCFGDQLEIELPIYGRELEIKWSDGFLGKKRTLTDDFSGFAEIWSGDQLLSRTEDINISFTKLPDPTIEIENLENGATVTLNFDVNINNLEISWSHDPNLTFTTARGLAPGVYTISLTNTQGCTKTIEIEVPLITSIDVPIETGIEVITSLGTWRLNTKSSFTLTNIYLLNEQFELKEIHFINGRTELIELSTNKVYQFIFKMDNQIAIKHRFLVPN